MVASRKVTSVLKYVKACAVSHVNWKDIYVENIQVLSLMTSFKIKKS